jgi:lipoyl(octanoyl) transferase
MTATTAYSTDVQYIEVCERLKVMRRQESTHYITPDYLAAEWQARLAEDSAQDDIAREVNELSNPSEGSSSQATSSLINELWREKICEWCYQVVDHFDFNREVVNVAMTYLDRYLATRTVNRRIFQLAAMTALYLAIKLFEPGKLRMSSLIELSRGYFLADHIVAMEDSMLQALSWHVHPPTPFAFCRDLTKLISADVTPRIRHDVSELARFLTELSVCDYYFVTRKPSSIAMASIINAIELTGPHKIDPRYKVQFLHHVVEAGLDIANDDEIIQCYERLREMYIAGGYTPSTDDDDEDESDNIRVETGSPTGVADGPDSRSVSAINHEDAMECA